MSARRLDASERICDAPTHRAGDSVTTGFSGGAVGAGIDAGGVVCEGVAGTLAVVEDSKPPVRAPVGLT